MENSNKRGGAKAWNTKYNYGVPINSDSLTQEEYKQCAKEWSEGDKNLEELLYTCLTKEIETIACCSGHNGEVSRERSWHPYIVFAINEKNESIIDSIATYFKDFDGVKIIYDGENNVRGYKVNFCFPRGTNTEIFGQMNELCNSTNREADNTFSALRKKVEEGEVEQIYYRKGEVLDEFQYPQDGIIDILKDNKSDKSTYHFLIRKDSSNEPYYKGCKDVSEILDEYLISDESLEEIAKRSKEISVKDFFISIKEKIKKFLNNVKTTEEKTKGE